MNRAQQRTASGIAVFVVLGGIGYFLYVRPADEPVRPSAPRASIAPSSLPAALPSATNEPAPPPAVRMAERVPLAPATLPSATEKWEDAVRGITAEQRQASVDRQHARVTFAMIQQVVDELGITGAVRERLEQLLFAKAYAHLDTRTAARGLGLSPDDPKVEALLQSELAAIDNEIRSLVGNDRFGRVEQNVSRFRDRLYAVEFVGELYQRGMPLSVDQRATVNKLVTALDVGDARRWSNSPLDPASGLTAYDSSVLRELADFLTPEQLEVIRQTRIDVNLHRAHEDYRRSQSKAKAPGP